MKLAVVQTNPVFGEVKSNIQEAIDLMDSVNADFYVLPELFNTGYNFINAEEVQKLAEPTGGITMRAMQEWATNKNCYVVYGFAEKNENIFNSSALVDSQGVIGIYRKVHLFDRENLFFSPGNLCFPVYETRFGKIWMMICFDWIFPESARSLMLKGAQLIAHPSNLVLPYCPDAMVTRCVENKIFAATADRVGNEERGGYKLKFIGMSEIVTPDGTVLCRLGSNESSISFAEVDLSFALSKKVNSFNDLLDNRRVEQYHR